MNSQLIEKVSVEEVFVGEFPIDLVWEEEDTNDDELVFCDECGNELERFCDGDLHCKVCEGSCVCCHSGDGPGADDEDGDMFDFNL
jgi:hypothetical protein